MTVAEAIRAATARLSAVSDTARLDSELLMAHALGSNRSDLLLRHLTDTEPAGFDALVQRRAAHEPVAYITGIAEFFGREFKVTPDVLIPRGDSETLIEAALETGPNTGRILDLGVGSGALLLTVLAERPDMTGIGVDASPDAVFVALDNATRLGINTRPDPSEVKAFADDLAAQGLKIDPRNIAAMPRGRVEFLCLDWTKRGWRDHLGTFDLILCNPPYVEEDAQLDPDVRDYEPAEALFAGEDGLDDYRVIIPQLGKLLNEGGIAILEIGHTQAESVTRIAESAGFAVEIRNDLANRPRCAILR